MQWKVARAVGHMTDLNVKCLPRSAVLRQNILAEPLDSQPSCLLSNRHGQRFLRAPLWRAGVQAQAAAQSAVAL